MILLPIFHFGFCRILFGCDILNCSDKSASSVYDCCAPGVNPQEKVGRGPG